MRLFLSGPNNLSLTKFIVLNPKVFKEYLTTIMGNVIYDGRVNTPNSTMTPIDVVCIMVTIMSFSCTLSDIKLKV